MAACAEYVGGLSPRRKKRDNAAKILLQHICEELMTDFEAPVTIKMLMEVVKVNHENDLISFLQCYPYLFEVKCHDCDEIPLWTVLPKTDIQLCEEYTEEGGRCRKYMCSDLHICKFFLFGKDGCKRPDVGKKSCHFLHDLKSAHNLRILQESLLDELSVEEIQFIFKLNASRSSQKHTTMNDVPFTCKFYNSGPSGCVKGSSCPFLHLCSHFILGNCKFQGSCKRNHDLYGPQPRAILRKCGLDPHQTKASVILGILKKKLNEAGMKETIAWRSAVAPGLSMGGARPKINQSGVPLLSPRHYFSSMPDPKFQMNISIQPEICSYFVKGNCRFANWCNNIHPSSKLPYQWQVTLSGYREDEWKDVEQAVNTSLERAYSDPSQSRCRFNTEGLVCIVHFDTMTLLVGQSNSKIRRLSTPSSEKEGQKHTGLSTEWVWFWQDMDKSWKQYGNQGHQRSKANVSSADLERRYLTAPDEDLHFSTDSYQYVMNFTKMEQRNVVLGTKRTVRRRPVLVTLETLSGKIKRDTDKMKEQIRLSNIIPANWKSQSSSLDTFCKVKVDRTGSTEAEFTEIESLVLKSLEAEGDYMTQIKCIFRVQNLELLEQFESKKRWMMKKSSSPGSSLERRLYHGTRQKYIDAICQQGFDFRVSGQSTGTKFGKGAYFSVSAKYSSLYTDSNELFVARVLTGDFTIGDKNYTRPPPKPQTSQLFDSCVDQVKNPTMFIVFDITQAYPEYIVQLE